MRSLLFGIVITLFCVFAGNVHASNELDGKAVYCSNEVIIPSIGTIIKTDFGFIFFGEKVIGLHVQGYKIKNTGEFDYQLIGTDKVVSEILTLDRRTLRSKNNGQCEVSSKQKIIKKLKDIIANAKKKNKI